MLITFKYDTLHENDRLVPVVGGTAVLLIAAAVLMGRWQRLENEHVSRWLHRRRISQTRARALVAGPGTVAQGQARRRGPAAPPATALALAPAMLLPTKVHDGGECPICLEEFEKGDGRQVLQCGHVLHRQCLSQLISTNCRLCPICRKPTTRLARVLSVALT